MNFGLALIYKSFRNNNKKKEISQSAPPTTIKGSTEEETNITDGDGDSSNEDINSSTDVQGNYDFWIGEVREKGLAWLTTLKGRDFACDLVSHMIDHNYNPPPLLTDPIQFPFDDIMMDEARKILAVNFKGYCTSLKCQKKLITI